MSLDDILKGFKRIGEMYSFIYDYPELLKNIFIEISNKIQKKIRTIPQINSIKVIDFMSTLANVFSIYFRFK